MGAPASGRPGAGLSAPKAPAATPPVDDGCTPQSFAGVRPRVVRAGGRPTFSGLEKRRSRITERTARPGTLSPHPLFEPDHARATDHPTDATSAPTSISPPRGPAVAPTRAGTSGPTSAASPAPHDTSTVRSATSRRDSPTRPRSTCSGLAGPTQVRWGEAQAWRDVALTWTAQQRLKLPPYTAEPPDDTALRDLAPVEHTPETLVSIVIPTWNRSALLRRALASVRDQTWSHWEALVVDDGSEDDTREVVAALAEEDPRIRLIARPHEGVCAARNAGLAEARGGFIAFLDSDNEWMPGFLETMVRRDDRARPRCGVRVADGDDQGRSALPQPTRSLREILRVANHVDLNVLVVRSTLMQRIGGFDTDLAAYRRLRPGAAHRRRDRPRLRPGGRRPV